MKTSWRNLQLFAAVADGYLNGKQGESKISYAIKRVRDQIARHNERLQERMADIEIDLCVADEKEVIQRDAGGRLQFTRAKLKERNLRERALLEEEFEIEPFFISAPADLTNLQAEAFSGLVLRADEPIEANGDAAPVPAGVEPAAAEAAA